MSEITNTQAAKPNPFKLNLKFFLKVLPGIFLILFLFIGTLSIFLKRSTYKLPSEGSWINGEAAAKYEKQFDESLPLKDAYISTWGIIEYTLFKGGREGVLIGKDGWLFTNEEYSYYEDEKAAIAEKINYIKKVQGTLGAEGSELVIVIVPAKARIYSEYSGKYLLPNYVQGRYKREMSALKEANIQTIEVEKALLAAKSQGQLYYKTDTHWTPLGANVVAKAIAKELKQASYSLPFEQNTFVTKTLSEGTFMGDLTKFIPLGVLKPYLGSKPENLPEFATVQTNLNLFADNTIQITLVGSSYSGDARWNFSGALKEALGMNIMNVAKVGQGEILPMENYLANEFLEHKPKLVIWQISERGFPMSLENH